MKQEINKKTMKALVEIAKANSAEIEARGDLETRRSDGEDFKEVAVWDLKNMLIEAYKLGKKDAEGK